MIAASKAGGSITSVRDNSKRSAIIEAIAAYDLPGSGMWNPLDELSTHTQFEEVDAVPDGIFEKSEGDFEALATVYVTLDYGDEDDSSSMSDAYPAHVLGRYDPGSRTASITEPTVDASSLYR